ncbi:alpha/beta fold hydrolase [Leeia aquatica]|uniref:Alpha/beta hydrolase n=1 Tax=Leeia aquatica TaxID=2725557 RepID=A0A847S5T8_9NEIS|nr:alpha/beta hydrolase [Leeia aquatica]NLR74165.1 alpha/beta hydrolase [Leeia aquatica]
MQRRFKAAIAGLLWVAASMAVAGPACSPGMLPVNGHGLWVNHQAGAQPTLVFEAGGGNDATGWSRFLEQAKPLGLSTFVYDRAGLGNSEVDPSPYTVQREVAALAAALEACEVKGDLILVAHSYGGNIALLLAAQHRQVKGVVLLDTVIPGYNTAERIQKILDTYRPQYPEIREKAPKLAAAVIPMMEAYPDTAKALDAVSLPPGLPVVDIVAEKPAVDTPEEAAAWHAAHRAFVQKDTSRSYVLAKDSGHKVMVDRPDLVLRAIETLLQRITVQP